METLWYYAALLLAKILMALPIRVVATLGRAGGALAYHIDRRHQRVALENFRRCWPEFTNEERRKMAHEHFRRLGENYACAVTTAGMSDGEIANHLEFVGMEKLMASPRGAVVAIGHFGNFELYARIASRLPRIRSATTYRALKQPRLDALVRQLRSKSGCRLFDRRREMKALLQALREGGIVLGLLSDQHTGKKGVRIPFFGRDCSTTTAPAVLAQRFGLPLFTAVCFRVARARWRIEIGEEIPTYTDATRRAADEVMRDINFVLEQAVRRDPANWFWVHDRWRFAKRRKSANRVATARGVLDNV